MIINKLLGLIFGLALTISSNAQEESMFLAAQLNVNKQYLFGDNIYSNNHNASNPFLGFSLEVSYKKKAFVDFHFCNISHESTSKKYIQNSTQLNQRMFSFGYHFPIKSWLRVSPSISIGSGNGKNDGKFDGLAYGFGVQGTLKIWRKISVFIKSDFVRYDFDIKSTKELEPLFDHTNGIVLGSGIRYGF